MHLVQLPDQHTCLQTLPQLQLASNICQSPCRRASGAARTSRKPLSPSKIALLAPGVEQAHDPSEAAPIPLFSADPVIIDLDQVRPRLMPCSAMTLRNAQPSVAVQLFHDVA